MSKKKKTKKKYYIRFPYKEYWSESENEKNRSEFIKALKKVIKPKGIIMAFDKQIDSPIVQEL